MVTNVTSFARSGLADFVVQRVTAVVLAIYTLCVVSWFLANPAPSFAEISHFFAHPLMKAFSTAALLSTIAHGWIGMWTIGTDYIRQHYFGSHAMFFRLTYQSICIFVLFVYAVWGLQIIWSV